MYEDRVVTEEMKEKLAEKVRQHLERNQLDYSDWSEILTLLLRARKKRYMERQEDRLRQSILADVKDVG